MSDSAQWRDAEQVLREIGVVAGDEVTGRSFSHVDLSRCLIDQVKFSGCSFVECSFENARIQHSDFAFCRFENVNFDGALMIAVHFSGGRISGSVMRNATLVLSHFQHVRFSQSETDPSWLDYSEIDRDFVETFNEGLNSMDDGSALDARGSTLIATSFVDSRLCWCEFSNSTISGATFSGSSLLQAKMRDAVLIDCDFSSANLVPPFFGSTWRDYNPAISGGGHWDQVMDWEDFLGLEEDATNFDDTWVDFAGIRHNSGEWSNDGMSRGTEWPQGFTAGPPTASRDELSWLSNAAWWPEVEGAFGYPEEDAG